MSKDLLPIHNLELALIILSAMWIGFIMGRLYQIYDTPETITGINRHNDR